MSGSAAGYVRMTGRLLAVLAVALWVVVLVAPHAGAASPASSGVASTPTSTPSQSSSCPRGSTCATIPEHCPTGRVCPEVIVNPAVDLGSNQWVFITAEHFPPGDPIYVYYCSNLVPLSKKEPVCMLQSTPEILNPEVILTASAAGSASISYETEEDVNDGNPALIGKVPGTETNGTFFCDDAPDPCSIDVSDPLYNSGGQTVLTLNPGNATVVPVTFAKPTGGCKQATFVPTASEFGIDRIFPIMAEYDCVGKAPSIAFNTSIDSASAVTGLLGGADQMAFIDDTTSPDVVADLDQLNTGAERGYSLIPVALSSIDVAFKATMADDTSGRIYPDNTFELTPNMVAGLVTDFYSNVTGADLANCGTVNDGQCGLLGALNTPNGFRGASEYGGYVRADTSSSTSEVFNWLCHAPVVPVRLDGVSVREVHTPARVLIAGLKAGGGKGIHGCPDTDEFPSLLNTFSWVAASDPSIQTKNLAAFVVPPNESLSPVAGFAPMNASEANYYGLLPAALQNASGHFVLPTARTLDAAVSGAHHNSDGTLTPNFRDKNPLAYPLPEFWYAVVPTSRLTAQSAAADRTLLHDLLKMTAGSQKADLPPGFVPLPHSLASQASREIARIAATPTPPTTTLPLPAVTTTTQPNVTPTTRAKVTPTTQPTVTNTTTPKAPPTTRAFQTTAFSVAGHSDSWLAPAFVSVVAGALLFGPGLLLKTRRRPGR